MASYPGYAPVDMTYPPQYASQPTPNMHQSEGSYGTLAGTPSGQTAFYDSPKFNGSVPLTNDTRPFLAPQTRRRRPSWWRAIATRSRRFARFAYGTCLVMFLILWVIINVVFTTRERRHEAKYSTADLNAKGDLLRQKQTIDKEATQFLFMKGNLRGFDSEKSILTVDWEGLLVDAGKNDLHLGSTDDVRYNLAVFRDVSTERDLATEALVAKLDPNGTLTQYSEYRVFKPADPPVGYIGRSPADSVTTDITMGQLDNGGAMKQPNVAYPWDRSRGQITFAVSDNTTVNAFNTSRGTFLIQIMGAVIDESIMNYQVDVDNVVACGDAFPGCQVDITLELQRPGLVKAVVITTVVINWLITLAVCVLTGEVIVLGRAHILSGSDILSICLTSLFALPSVRSILPGAPPFGCLLDMVGILPNIILISICTTAFAIAKVRNRLQEDEEMKKLEE